MRIIEREGKKQIRAVVVVVVEVEVVVVVVVVVVVLYSYSAIHSPGCLSSSLLV